CAPGKHSRTHCAFCKVSCDVDPPDEKGNAQEIGSRIKNGRGCDADYPDRICVICIIPSFTRGGLRIALRATGEVMNRTYGFSMQFGTDFDRALDVLTRELKKQGFGIVTDINLQAIFKEKLAVDEGRYRILGVCNPWVAHQALRADPDIGLL